MEKGYGGSVMSKLTSAWEGLGYLESAFLFVQACTRSGSVSVSSEERTSLLLSGLPNSKGIPVSLSVEIPSYLIQQHRVDLELFVEEKTAVS